VEGIPKPTHSEGEVILYVQHVNMSCRTEGWIIQDIFSCIGLNQNSKHNTECSDTDGYCTQDFEKAKKKIRHEHAS
jgi:hypothetical protein